MPPEFDFKAWRKANPEANYEASAEPRKESYKVREEIDKKLMQKAVEAYKIASRGIVRGATPQEKKAGLEAQEDAYVLSRMRAGISEKQARIEHRRG